MCTYIVIPAYKPNERLVDLVRTLKEKDYRVLVIDDGSGAEFARIFEQTQELGAEILRHEKNKGKGAALKTAFGHLAERKVLGVAITADADGQHTPEDIAKVEAAAKENPEKLIIGGRSFTGQVPLRSRVGNSFTRFVFRLATGLKIRDTQTGLRAIPSGLWDKMLKVEGERYEYEMNMLLNLKKWGIGYLEVPIETIYIEDNASSHFHPIRDGLTVFSQIIKFCASSLVCAGVDYLIYILLLLVIPVNYSYIGARIVSGTLNYMLCVRVVFQDKPSIWNFLSYVALAVFVMVVGSLGVTGLTSLGIGNIISKIMVDVVLFVFNFFVQKKLIFRHKKAKAAEEN